jgi:hypothetical protein
LEEKRREESEVSYVAFYTPLPRASESGSDSTLDAGECANFRVYCQYLLQKYNKNFHAVTNLVHRHERKEKVLKIFVAPRANVFILAPALLLAMLIKNKTTMIEVYA